MGHQKKTYCLLQREFWVFPIVFHYYGICFVRIFIFHLGSQVTHLCYSRQLQFSFINFQSFLCCETIRL